MWNEFVTMLLYIRHTKSRQTSQECQVLRRDRMYPGVPKLRLFAFALALFGLMALSTGLAYGQTTSGNIVGTVIDSSGAAVVNADVTATNVATNVSASTKTGSSGEYRFDNLLAGTYRISVKSSGFR